MNCNDNKIIILIGCCCCCRQHLARHNIGVTLHTFLCYIVETFPRLKKKIKQFLTQRCQRKVYGQFSSCVPCIWYWTVIWYIDWWKSNYTFQLIISFFCVFWLFKALHLCQNHIVTSTKNAQLESLKFWFHCLRQWT